MNIYTERIEQLRKMMSEEGIGLYYISSDDYHGSEYVADYFKYIQWICGFTGEAAWVVITADGAWLYADGRYYIQAENEINGTCVDLMRYGAPGVPDPDAFVAEKMEQLIKDGKKLGFNGNTVSYKEAEKLIRAIEKRVGHKDFHTVSDRDLVGEIWTDRPKQVFSEVWILDEKYTGESVESKISRVREQLSEKVYGKPYVYLLSSLDDIAWLYNIRANDIPNNPEAFAYSMITEEKAVLFLGEGVAGNVIDDMKKAGVEIGKYDVDCLKIKTDRKVLMDFRKTSRAIYDSYDEAQIVDIINPSELMKGIKNDVELECTKNVLLRDASYITRFMKWLKEKAAEAGPGELMKNDDGSVMTEITVDEKIDEFRTKDSLYIEKSFDTIAAYRANAAMMHYSATPENHSEIRAEGMLLVDSGIQCYDGTTDITRTFALGKLSEEEIKAFTLTAVSMLRMMDVKFIEGCTGENLDIVAREPMWREGMDYKCGTGHGIGHVLNVHEGPHSLRWRITANGQSVPLKENMIVTDEPGVYRGGKFGVRTENEIVVKKCMVTDDGTFYGFEPLTFIPIDLDAIDKKYMTKEDVDLLNDYHKKVYLKLSKLLDEETLEWLKEYTKEI